MALLQDGQIIRETYEVERFLGEGAFAEVYRVKHRFLGRHAMKVFKRLGMTVPEIEDMLGEAIMLSRIGHPNIVRVFDANVLETPAGLCGYFTMENVPGGSLEKFWHSHGTKLVPIETSVDIIRQVCRGLTVAHRETPPVIRLAVLAACALAIIITDLLVFQTRCLTHREGVSPVVEATLHPQFANPLNFLSIFVAYSRLHLALSVLFLLGVPFALKNKNRNVVALYFFVFSGAVFTNLLVTGDSLRYQYWLIPMWLLLAVYGPKAVMDYLNEVLSPGGNSAGVRHAWAKPVLSVILYASAILSLSPWRILDSYDAKLLGDSTGAFQFVNTNMRPGDVVAATEPHPHGALLETGRSDYDISFPRLYDFIYLKNGRLIDRNAGAESVSSVNELADIFASHDRVWIVINREKFRSRGENIRWEYPGARAELFLRRNCTVAYQGYLWTVFLWDVRQGNYSTFRTSLTQ